MAPPEAGSLGISVVVTFNAYKCVSMVSVSMGGAACAVCVLGNDAATNNDSVTTICNAIDTGRRCGSQPRRASTPT